MSLAATIYRTVFKKTSTYFMVLLAGAFVLEGGIDYAAEAIYNNINRGKLWHHIEDNYKKAEE